MSAPPITLDSVVVAQSFLYNDLINGLKREDAEAVEAAISKDPKPGGWTLLHEACRRHHPHTVQALLEAGVPANAEDRYGWTPLHEASMNCGPLAISVDAVNGKAMPMMPDEPTAIAIALLDAGADPAAEDEFGETPLHWAKHCRNTEMADVLSARPAPPAVAQPGAEQAP